ncbi:DUF5953 family protein [Corallococcus soli]|nr:DUF5953 family protein [Corallococcus soli]
MTASNRLVLTVYAPALRGSEGRMLAAIQGMERALPGLRMEWEISRQGTPIALPQRDAWFAESEARGRFPLVCNGDERYPVTIGGLTTPSGQSPGGQPLLDVQAELPLDAAVIAAAAEMLVQVAEGVQALWGHMTPAAMMQDIADQTGPKSYGPGKPPRGLPALKFPEAIPAPEVPRCLGWLNYWSDAAARAIGFPDPARDAELLARSRRTATGGWVVRLTEEPMDLDEAAHLDTLLRTYERFPEIGGRSVP